MIDMYYCGWDGGGSKTQVCALHQDGTPMKTADFGPLNLNGSSREIVGNTIADCVRYMTTLPGGLEACLGLVIGMAGVSNQRVTRLVEETVRKCGYTGPLKVLGDQEIALAGAVEGPGAVLIAGTGAICFGKDAEGKPFRCGGYGYLIDDGGSGYAIGRDILIAVAHAEDGRGPVTCLTQGVYEFLHVSSIGEVITWLYNPDTGKKQIAALAPLLLKALEQGDEAAKEIASHAANDLAGLVVAAWRKTGMRGGEVALSGSILKYYPVIRDDVLWRLREALPDTQFIEPRGSASFGAAKLAMTAL